MPGGRGVWACMVVGGMHSGGGMCGGGGACVVAWGTCMVAQSHACMVAGGGCMRYNEIWSMSGQYASYWNAFLFTKKCLQKAFDDSDFTLAYYHLSFYMCSSIWSNGACSKEYLANFRIAILTTPGPSRKKI